ncbi:MAG: Maf family nucleotide pyrophosphatase [Bacteroidota bacterium]
MTENPLVKKLKDHKIILASGSPRRRKFLEEMGVPFEIRIPDVEEIYPKYLKAEEISDHLAILKAAALQADLKSNEILITSDTVVWYKNTSLAKAANTKEAMEMLNKLSGEWHQVITSVCITTPRSQKTENAVTRVKFRALTQEEITFYIEQYHPYDKAGAYGIQEWLGAIGIEEIRGSYNNVVGFPSHLVYKTLMDMVG